MSETPVGQGHGIEGRYAGLPDRFCHPQHSKIVIIPVPFDETTTYQKGTDQGPQALIEASRNLELYDIETDSEVYTLGIYTAPPIHTSSSQDMLAALYEETIKYIKQDQFVVVLGGEHSISFAPIKAHAEHFPHLSILQFDAHLDLQISYEGDPWSHACVMARVREISAISSVTAVGIRSMSREELPVLDRSHTFFSHTLDSSFDWIDRIVDQLSEHVYITFDLDVFDSSIMPSTGTPEPGGMSWQQINKLLEKVIQKKTLVGFDVVELCPSPTLIAPDYLAAKLVYKILSYKFKK